MGKSWRDLKRKFETEDQMKARYIKIIAQGENEIYRLQETNRRLEQDIDVLKAAAGAEAAYRNRLRAEKDAERKRYDTLLRGE